MKIKDFNLGTILLTNASKAEKFRNSLALHPKGIIFDLKEGYFAHQKDAARKDLYNFLSSLNLEEAITLGIRFNLLNTKIGFDDLYAYLTSSFNVDYLVLPNVEAGEVVTLVSDLLDAYNKKTSLILSIDTPSGVAKMAKTLERANLSKVHALAIASDNFVFSTGVSLDSTLLKFARMNLVTNAKLYNLKVYDGPSFEVGNLDLLKASTISARDDGFSGRIINHPRHIETVNLIFNDTHLEKAFAKEIWEAHKNDLEKLQEEDSQLYRYLKIFKD